MLNHAKVLFFKVCKGSIVVLLPKDRILSSSPVFC